MYWWGRKNIPAIVSSSRAQRNKAYQSKALAREDVSHASSWNLLPRPYTRLECNRTHLQLQENSRARWGTDTHGVKELKTLSIYSESTRETYVVSMYWKLYDNDNNLYSYKKNTLQFMAKDKQQSSIIRMPVESYKNLFATLHVM